MQRTQGTPMPWPMLEDRFEIRPGELTLVAGANGSLKSMMAGQLIAWALTDNWRCFIASFEMSPQETLRRIVTQCAGSSGFTREYAIAWGQAYRDRLWLWDKQDVVPSDVVLERIEAVAKHLDLRLIVIDSLLKCGLAQDGDGYLSGQTAFVDRLQHAVKHLGVHVLLVVHLRKPERGARSTKYDIRGASQISDLADNVLLLHRNQIKREAEQLLEHATPLTREQEEALTKPDLILEVAKQRHASWEGIVRMDFDPRSLLLTQHNQAGRYRWPGDIRG
jgi:twinkle protein